MPNSLSDGRRQLHSGMVRLSGRFSPSNRGRWLALVVAINFGLWVGDAIHEWGVRGLFPDLGGDWGRFWGASRAYISVAPAAAYRLPEIANYMHPLLRYTRIGGGGIHVGPVPYPPLFLRLFSIFTLPPPPLGFLLWTTCNVVIAAYVAWTLAGRFHRDARWLVTLVILGAYPLMMGLFQGQVVVLLLICLLEAVIAFEQGQELRGGIWSGLLVLKPQYVGCLFLVFLLKRRINAVAGFALGATVMVVGSLVVGGDDGLLAYGRMLVTVYPRVSGSTGVDPHGMLGWRAIIAELLPGLGSTAGLVIVALISLITLASLPVIWRGGWDPASPRFMRQLTATFVVTLLVAFQSQPHGAALLLVPGAIFVAQGTPPASARRLLVTALVAAPPVGFVSALLVGDLSWASLMLNGVLIALLAILVRAEVASQRPGYRTSNTLADRRGRETALARRNPFPGQVGSEIGQSPTS